MSCTICMISILIDKSLSRKKNFDLGEVRISLDRCGSKCNWHNPEAQIYNFQNNQIRVIDIYPILLGVKHNTSTCKISVLY